MASHNQPKALFALGAVVITSGASDALDGSIELVELLGRHVSGDWGNLDPSDRTENERAIREGHRILSAYSTAHGARLWVITEADRSSTTVLLPDEY